MRIVVTAAAVCLSIVGLSVAEDAGAAMKRQFTNIPAQGLGPALQTLAQQREFQVVYLSDNVDSLRTNGAVGELTSDEALTQLLSGTGLTFRYLEDNTVTIFPSTSSASAGGDQAPGTGEGGTAQRGVRELLLAQNDSQGPQDSDTSSKSEKDPSETSSKGSSDSGEKLEEVIVTGTQIRGARNIASPISIYTREQIELTGTGSIQRFVLTLPENFQGSAWEGTVGSISGGSTTTNLVSGTAVSLRGLGADSTLVLLNGRRIAPGNRTGNFVDVSLIPLIAIERVEVVPDGGSALYGSDAVGGVINFITRKDFDGSEVSARYGAVTEGDLQELQITASTGLTWRSGSGILGYEYFDQQPLALNDKSWLRTPVPGPFDLLPEQKRHGIFASLNESAGDRVQLFGDLMYSERSTPNFRNWTPFFEQNVRADVVAFTGTIGAQIEIAGPHQVEIAASYGGSDTDQNILNLRSGLLSTHQDVNTDVLSLDSKLTGALPALLAGPVRYAFGAHYREENYKDFNLLAGSTSFKNQRHLWAAFGELRVPLIRSNSRDDGEPTLQLSIAGRYENYSDFGSTANPNIGLIWEPSSDLRFRGTWGKSFKAPLLNDLNPVHTQVAAVSAPDPLAVPPGNVPIVILLGGNADLGPEKAENWTLGVDWSPVLLPELRLGATYYNVKYEDRILAFTETGLGVSIFNVLQLESIAAPVIHRDPSVAQLEAAIANTLLFTDFSGPGFTPAPGGLDLTTVGALIDFRKRNLASVNTSGVDLNLSYKWNFNPVSIEAGLNGTYILEMDQQVVPTVAPIDVLNTLFNPADLKLRARAIIQRGGLNAALFVNHVSSYQNERFNPPARVAAWTTLDANLGYRFGENQGTWSGVSVAVGATNLTDEPPPFVDLAIDGLNMIHFDGANADPRGRFVYVQVTKSF